MFGASDRGFRCSSPCHVSHGDYVAQVKTWWTISHIFFLNSSQKGEFWPFFFFFPLFFGGLYCQAQLKKSTSAERRSACCLMVWAFFWILFQITLEKMGVSSAAACQLSFLSVLLHLCRWLHGWWHCLLLARKWFCCHGDGGARTAPVHHYRAEAGQQGSGLHHR